MWGSYSRESPRIPEHPWHRIAREGGLDRPICWRCGNPIPPWQEGVQQLGIIDVPATVTLCSLCSNWFDQAFCAACDKELPKDNKWQAGDDWYHWECLTPKEQEENGCL